MLNFIKSLFSRRERYTIDDPLVVTLTGDQFEIAICGKHMGSFSFDEIASITAYETQDFLGGTVTFAFELQDTRVFTIYAGDQGMSEVISYLWHEKGINLAMDKDQMKLLSSYKDITVYSK